MKTKASRNHLSVAASYPCIICGASEVELHHVSTGAGMGRKNPDCHVVSLCHIHHRTGGYGIAIHAGLKAWEDNFGKQSELLYTFLCQMENDRTLTEYALPTLLKLRLQYG
jgi:hypothetical protein